MKTVVTSDMVAHLWAHQSQEHARNASSSCSFQGLVFYSYRTPVAMLHDTKAGRVALVSSDGYSVTTRGKHIGPAYHALRGVARVFTVPYVGAYGGMAPRDPGGYSYSGSETYKPGAWHAANVAHLADEYRELGARIRRARWVNYTCAAGVQSALDGAAGIVRDYCAAFGLDVPALDVADDARVIWRAREIRDEKARDPATVAKRERAREQAEARKAERERIERLQRFEREAEYRQKFRDRAPGYYGRVSDEQGGALLRVDPDMVRTSWGAECPLEDARRAFPLIAKVRASGLGWQLSPGGHAAVTLGAFALHEIRADGSIRAGCHTINWPEIESAARALGIASK